MKRITTKTIAMAAMLTYAASAAMACPLAYAINFSGQFGIIDLATGSFTPVGAGLENTPDGIAGAPGGPFYTVDGATGHLLRLGLDGKVTDIGDTHTGANVGPDGVSVVASLADGSLYALDFSNKLYRINPNTAALTLLGALPGLPEQENEYVGNMTTSLNGDGSRLYYSVEVFDGPRKTGPTLYTINPANLSVTSRPLKLPSPVIGSGLVNGVFYMFGAAGEIIKLNPASGETTVAATYDSGVVDDGPPFTGIFGVVGALEPNSIGIGHVVASSAKVTHSGRRSHWPPRFAALPPRVQK